MADQMNSGNGTKKTVWYVVIGVIVLALIVWAIYAAMDKKSETAGTSGDTSMQGSASPTPSDAMASPTPTGTGATAASLAYEDALKKYPYRFQFSKCQAIPGKLSVKPGSTVMLDNRDAAAHTIKVGTSNVSIAGYGYTLFNASAEGSLNITCDGGNAGTLLVNSSTTTK